jgi:hypothetical protein
MLKEALTLLVEELCKIADQHEEVFDTAVREAMFEAVSRAFIVPQPGYKLPDDFEMFSPEGNKLVKAALAKFLANPQLIEAASKLATPQERLDAFQDPVETNAGNTQEEFFGFSDTPFVLTD